MGSLGGHLRESRTARGVSLDDIARATRVTKSYLEAREDERMADLPAPVFARGFIRAYCQFLQVPAEEALAEYGRLVGHPTESLQMVLATSDGRVFQSLDKGDHWSEVNKPPLNTLGFGGLITYNPYKPSEVWVASSLGGIYKSTDAAFTSWQGVMPADGVGTSDIKFTGADSVYITRYHSNNGGLNWQPFATITNE